MRIVQFAQFVVGSDDFDPDQITGLLSVEPTRVLRRGSRSTDPMIPRSNMWYYRARGHGTVDELVRELVDTFEPLSERLLTLTANAAASIGISIVRKFDDPAGVEDDEGGPELPANLVKLGGQHQLLGFHLDTRLMSRLIALDCSLDFDEYG